MKTIHIDKQESAAALASAFASALAASLGWTVDGTAVKKDDIPVYFEFYSQTGNTNVYTRVSNGYVSEGAGSVTFSAAKSYELYVAKSPSGAVTVGTRDSGGTPCLTAIIAQNTADEYVGITFSSNTTITIRGIETKARTLITKTPFSGDDINTSIMKMPDIWGAAMYKDLYLIFSCPFKSTNLALYIDGKNYRAIGADSAYMWMAIPEV